MLGNPPRDRKAERRAGTRAEILAAAWALAHEQGLSGISLRDLGARVGMRAQSLYSYFDSKFAIYDAMFAEGNALLLERTSSLPSPRDPDAGLRAGARVFFTFCVEDPARYQLLFQRTIPGFEPSAESYAIAGKVLEAATARLHAAGITTDRGRDLWTALLNGFADQQIANDPGGDRWGRLLDDAIDMFLAHLRGPGGQY